MNIWNNFCDPRDWLWHWWKLVWGQEEGSTEKTDADRDLESVSSYSFLWPPTFKQIHVLIIQLNDMNILPVRRLRTMFFVFRLGQNKN